MCSSIVSTPVISNPLYDSTITVPVINTVLVQHPEHGFIMDFTDSTPNDEYSFDPPLDNYVTIKTEPPDEEAHGTGLCIVQVSSGQYASDMMKMEYIKTGKAMDDSCNNSDVFEETTSHKSDQYVSCLYTRQDKNQKHEDLPNSNKENDMAKIIVKKQSEQLESHSNMKNLSIASIENSNMENNSLFIETSQHQNGDLKPASLKELCEASLNKHQISFLKGNLCLTGESVKMLIK